MRIGITGRFQNSYFSGSAPQIACALARALADVKHDVTLLHPKGEPSWFIDNQSYAERIPPRKEFGDEQFDVIIEVVWSLSPEDRLRYGKHVVLLAYRPPIFHDMESVCYQWNPVHKSYTNLSAIWMYDIYNDQDARYLEFLSGVQVYKVPFVWDADAIELFLKDQSIPEWQESAKKVEALIPSGTPISISWCARIMENNFSNTSHCVIPLNIVSVIRQRGDPIRFTVHNGDSTEKNNFFKSNIATNLLLPDISGNMQPRVRLPDLRREKTFLIGHQRFRPFKPYLMDALYMGIPTIHNSAFMKNLGSPYYYELNQIQQAVGAWKTMIADYENSTGFFNPKASAVRQALLRSRFSPQSVARAYNTILNKPMGVAKPITLPKQRDTQTLRVAFCNMWDQFQPKYNFFMYLLTWMGKINNIKVVEDSEHPNVAFFGPLSKGAESRYPGIPKVYFTGENAPSNKNADTILNIGFNYDTSPNYIRLPLWVTEINWWGANVDKMVNPKPVSLEDAMTVKTEMLEAKKKFCAFVATNGSCQNRNAAFQILNQWRGVDAGGRLFCNLPGGPIPAGLGGGGGELAKINFYKQYKFALTFENSSSPGYTTEKLFHAKVAGAVPIYWGDPFVDRDFDSRGFINANQVSSPEQLIELVNKVASNEEEWKRMASVPALSEYKKRWCQKTMEAVGKFIFKQILSKDVSVSTDDWATSEGFGRIYEANPDTIVEQQTSTSIVEQVRAKPASSTSAQSSCKKIFVTATNSKFVESAANVLNSMKSYEPDIEKIVYVWPDVSKEYHNVLRHCGATDIRILPTTIQSETPWSDFWEPHHYAWKLWVHANAIKEAPEDACILYLDAGTLITNPIDAIWNQIQTEGVFVLNDVDQINERWCHPACCKNLQITEDERKGNQITAGLIGYKKGHKYCVIAEKALAIAKAQRDSIVGEKWKAYSDTCLGHRHDQSILSIVTQREKAPRLPLRDFYSDISMRHAKQNKLPLYVHRGHYRDIVPFADGIDEAYIINLDRRKDRLERFDTSHPTIKDRVYRWPATDGRQLTLTKELMHLFRDNDFGWKKSVMGCALSHLGLWEKLANDTTAKQYLILEDDVRFEDRWLVKWMQSSRYIPKDADVIYLGGILPPNKAAFPQVIEPVNAHFGRVAKNNFFGSNRRYFHFCNYSYVLTKSGATKLMELVKAKGIFTSGDHMIVNHGDDLLNIYFTIPLFASCFQEDDPVYQKSEFNNFKRVDNFDSDLWNNTDCFSKEELAACIENKTVTATVAAPASENPIQIWNEFLKQIATNDKAHVGKSIDAIFAIWNKMSETDFEKHISWFRIFEQLILKQNDVLLENAEQIRKCIHALPKRTAIWDPILKALTPDIKSSNAQKIFHMPVINSKGIYETEWLHSIFPNGIEWVPLNTLGELANAEKPTLLVQHTPGHSLAEYAILFDVLANANIKVNVLHLSDEFGNDDIRFYEKASVNAVIRTYWRPDLKQYGDKVLVIPLGYANGRGGNQTTPTFTERKHIWGFAGSADRYGRIDALAKLRTVTPHAEYTKAEWSQPNMLDGSGYCDMLRNAKFTPCFRGSKALESYRLYEAIEHGAIPVYVPAESANSEDELKELYGVHPFVGIPSWEHGVQLLPILAQQSEVMEKHRKVIMEWWAMKKAEIKQKIAQIYS